MGNTLPENWVETELGNILYLKNGYAFKSSDYTSKGIAILKISNISRDGTINLDGCDYISKENVKENFFVERGDILIAMSGATTGKFGIFNSPDIVLQNQRVGNLKLYSNSLFNKKLLFYLVSELKSKIEALAYGGAQPNISPSLIETLRFSLPPLAEQQRIVAKLDVYFAEIEQMKTILFRVPGIIKNLRQQILTHALTGELTRVEGKLINTTIGSLFEVRTGATPLKSNASYYERGNIPWIKSGEVKNTLIDETEEFITELALKETNAQVFPEDTLLIAMYGEGKTRGQVGWMKIRGATNQAIAALVNENVDNEIRQYVFYYCLSQYNEIRSKAEGGNQPNLNLTKIKNWAVRIPEQKCDITVIVKKVKTLFHQLEKIDSQYHNLKLKIENLPSTILHQAFQGKLVPQLSTDGNAKDLLDQITQLKNQTDKISKKVKENVK